MRSKDWIDRALWDKHPATTRAVEIPCSATRTVRPRSRDLLIALGVFAAVWLVALVALIVAGRRMAARRLVKAVPDLVALLRGLRKDPRVPRRAKRWLLVALAWVLSPIDLVPEFIPIVGPLDDIVVVVLVLRHLLKSTPREVIAEHWRGDPVVLKKTLRFAGRFPGGQSRRTVGRSELRP